MNRTITENSLINLEKNLKNNWRPLISLIKGDENSSSDLLIVGRTPEYNPQMISDAFNSYFISHVQEVVAQIPICRNNYINSIHYVPYSMVFCIKCRCSRGYQCK